MKKVVIIGSGLGGLSSGVILAKNGYKVTVVEQGHQIGGCLQCFSRHGARFETGMHFIGSADPGQVLDRMMRYLEIDDRVTLARLDTDGYNIISLDGERFAIANGREQFVDRLSAYFPSQRDNLNRYYDVVESVSAASALHTLKTDGNNAVTLRYQMEPIDAVIDSIIDDRMLRDVLVGDLPLYAAERGKTPFSVHAFIMDFYNRSAFRVAGGSDGIAKALAAVLSQHGGEVLTDSPATAIVCDSSHATGVEIGGSQLLDADYVISAVHPMRTLELLGDTHLIRPAFRRRIQSMPQTVGAFSVYLRFKDGAVPYMNHNFFGYNQPSPWGCGDYDDSSWPKGYLYMHTCDAVGQKYARSGVILTYMHIEELQQWRGTAVGRRGDGYRAFVDERARRVIASLERQMPGITDSIEQYYVASPLTYESYTGSEGGSLYGVAKDVALGAACRVPHRMRVPNVLQAGQNINSHGMLGVVVGSIVACGELLTPQYLYQQMLEK